MSTVHDAMEALARTTQDAVCAALEAADGGRFREDVWERPGGGGGRSRTLEGGAVIERAGVNVAAVHGVMPEEAAASAGAGGHAGPFRAVGVSGIIHPRNPFVPTAHFNYRYFELGGGATWWFGGGADLTPYYLFDDDARHFHETLREACGRHGDELYARFSAWCDEYFFIPHRGEARGVGGIFFDRLADREPAALLALVRDCAAAFVPSYLPIVERRRATPYDERHREWQATRRGRYVEFNLVYDRGTAFGLRTGGRTESVLVSMPPTARWGTEAVPPAGSDEARLLEVLRRPRRWA